LYEGGATAALQLPTFISNHDDGRFGYFVRKSRPAAPDEEVLSRVMLGYAMLFTLRGVPVIYYGDEQGLAGAGGDRDARQDLFPSRTADYAAERPIGTQASTPDGAARGSFERRHPLYRAIAELAALRRDNAALREGAQIVRQYSRAPGIFAVSRMDPGSGEEVLIAFNTSTEPVDAQVLVDPRSQRFLSLHGRCALAPAAGSYRVELAPLGYVVCASAAP
jgi:glycosidase